PYTGDTVTLGGTATGTFADKNVANGIAVTVSGNTLSGLQAADYKLALNEQSGLSANDRQSVVKGKGVGATNRCYDATTEITLTGTPAQLGAASPDSSLTTDGTPYTGDAVTLGGTATGTFADKNVANGIAVTVSGNTLSGLQAADYKLALNEQSGLSA